MLRCHAFGIYRDAPFAGAVDELRQRQPHVLAIVDPVSGDEQQIALLDMAFAQLLMQRLQGAACLGQHQDARGSPVEPVREFEKGLLGPRRTRAFDHSVEHATAAVRRDAGRLVDDDEIIVFVRIGGISGGTARAPVTPLRSPVRSGGTRMSSPACSR